MLFELHIVDATGGDFPVFEIEVLHSGVSSNMSILKDYTFKPRNLYY